MDFQIVNKTLVISEGTTELHFKDIRNIFSKIEIEEASLPSTIKVICDDTFFDYPGIKRINIPMSVQCIGARAFWGLDDLEEIFLPGTIQSVGRHAFCNCVKLKITIIGNNETIPAGWDKEFAINVKEICFQ